MTEAGARRRAPIVLHGSPGSSSGMGRAQSRCPWLWWLTPTADTGPVLSIVIGPIVLTDLHLPSASSGGGEEVCEKGYPPKTDKIHPLS